MVKENIHKLKNNKSPVVYGFTYKISVIELTQVLCRVSNYAVAESWSQSDAVLFMGMMKTPSSERLTTCSAIFL